MNLSIARAGRRTTRTLSVTAAAVATVALLAACAGSADEVSAGASSDDTTTASAGASGASTDVMVIDQTNLLLVTAQETLEARGLEVQVADASGQGRPVEDPTQWVVVTQDPLSGTVEKGSDVTLTVRMTTDPVG